MTFTFKLSQRLARCLTTPTTAARARSTPRRAPVFPPSLIPPSDNRHAIAEKPIRSVGRFAVSQMP